MCGQLSGARVNFVDVGGATTRLGGVALRGSLSQRADCSTSIGERLSGDSLGAESGQRARSEHAVMNAMVVKWIVIVCKFLGSFIKSKFS